MWGENLRRKILQHRPAVLRGDAVPERAAEVLQSVDRSEVCQVPRPLHCDPGAVSINARQGRPLRDIAAGVNRNHEAGGRMDRSPSQVAPVTCASPSSPPQLLVCLNSGVSRRTMGRISPVARTEAPIFITFIIIYGLYET